MPESVSCFIKSTNIKILLYRLPWIRRIYGGLWLDKDPDASLDLVFRGDSLQQQYQVGLGGYIGKVDLQALHLMQEPLTMGLKVDLQGFIGEHSAYALKARFDSLSMADSRKTYTLGSLDIDMASDLKKTTLDVKTGDLQLTFGRYFFGRFWGECWENCRDCREADRR